MHDPLPGPQSTRQLLRLSCGAGDLLQILRSIEVPRRCLTTPGRGQSSLPKDQLMKATQHLALRKPQRICVTLPHATHEQLIQLSLTQGRSISNLAAYFLERSIAALPAQA